MFLNMTMAGKRKKPSLPVIRLALLAPIVEELTAIAVDFTAVFESFSVDPADIDNPDVWIAAPKMYALVESLAALSGDPCFGVHAGEKLNPWDWPPTARAAGSSRTVGEFLLRFMEDAGAETNSCTFILETAGQRSTFQERRVTDGKVQPAHNDGYTIAYLLDILRGAMGLSWDGSQVVARVCDPESVPNGYLGIRTAKTDTMGASITFPSRWLLQQMAYQDSASSDPDELRTSLPASNVVDALRSAITPHLHEFHLNAERAAEICGINKRTLARRLKRRGTSVSKEINSMRRQRASQLLAETDKSVGGIAQDVGYAEPAVFSRAFRRWTGMTPSVYRSKQRAGKGRETGK